jgi:hypothetical protein
VICAISIAFGICQGRKAQAVKRGLRGVEGLVLTVRSVNVHKRVVEVT